MDEIVIAGLGLYHPEESISNAELVASYNQHVDMYNKQNQSAIDSGEVVAKAYSDADFIESASGIKSRYVIDKKNILDPLIMHPVVPPAPRDQLSLQAKMSVEAAHEAIAQSGVDLANIDMVIVACSNLQRPYPAISIAVQHALGLVGHAYDMNVACSSAVFALQNAQDAIAAGRARAVLICNPEICTAHLNFQDRDCHFIFGDAAAAMVVAAKGYTHSDLSLEIKHSALTTQFSNAIRNEFGFLSKTHPDSIHNSVNLFNQDGRKVFKEVSALVASFLKNEILRSGLEMAAIRHYFLHQANAHMNQLILKRLLGSEPDPALAPLILDEFANTSSAGSVIALYRHQQQIQAGEYALLAAFGAGYSVGCAMLRQSS